MTVRTREQERQRLAWNCLVSEKRFRDQPHEWKKNDYASIYLRALKQTPARIHASGLGQAIAFLKAHKGEKEKKAIGWAADDISRLTLELLGEQGTDLLERLRDDDLSFQFAATDEALAVVGWLSAFLEGEDVKTGQQD